MLIPKDKKWLQKYKFYVLVIIFGFLLILIISIASDELDPARSEQNDLIVDRVKVGPFTRMVSAYGSLKPQQQRTIISRSTGTLIEVLKRPGEIVAEDSVVLILSNPEIASEVQRARLDLQKAEAELAALEAELQDKRLIMENERQLLQGDISLSKTELEAQEMLARSAIISELDLKKARMKLFQLELRYELEVKRKESATALFEAQMSSSKLAVQQAKDILKINVESERALHVEAGISGVLQSQQSSLELGQWVQQGEPLGVVSGTKDLFAELNVNALEASSIQLGMPVKLNIRGRVISGVVIRVAPNASNNQVQVDVDIEEELPDIARANLDVRGDIIILSITKGHTIIRPASYRDGQTLQLYTDIGSDQFRLQNIEVIEASEDLLLISEDVGVGTRVILTDPNYWDSKAIITIDR